MIPQTKLSAAFRRERARRNMSLRDAAAETGVYFTTLSRFENDIILLDMDNFARVAWWLKMPLSEDAVWAYPDNILDAILDVIRADDEVTDKDALCDIFAAAYNGLARC